MTHARLARRSAGTLALLAVLAAAGCGGSGPKGSSTGAPPIGDSATVRVVRAWSDTLRRGDVNGAARFFATPSTVSNGSDPVRIETVAEARFFNRTLPCGARVVGSEPTAHGFVLVTFVLTERPGGSCGTGTGHTARTAVRVRDGQITDWRRIPDAPDVPSSQT